MERSLIFKNKKLGKTKTKKLRHFVFFGSYVYTYKVHLCRIVLAVEVVYLMYTLLKFIIITIKTLQCTLYTPFPRSSVDIFDVRYFPNLQPPPCICTPYIQFCTRSYLSKYPTTHLLPLTHSLSSTMAFLSVLTGEYNAPSTNANLSSFRCFLASNFNSLDISYAVP